MKNEKMKTEFLAKLQDRSCDYFEDAAAAGGHETWHSKLQFSDAHTIDLATSVMLALNKQDLSLMNKRVLLLFVHELHAQADSGLSVLSFVENYLSSNALEIYNRNFLIDLVDPIEFDDSELLGLSNILDDRESKDYLEVGSHTRAHLAIDRLKLARDALRLLFVLESPAQTAMHSVDDDDRQIRILDNKLTRELLSLVLYCGS